MFQLQEHKCIHVHIVRFEPLFSPELEIKNIVPIGRPSTLPSIFDQIYTLAYQRGNSMNGHQQHKFDNNHYKFKSSQQA